MAGFSLRARGRWMLAGGALALAALACNIPRGADTEATAQAIYATITAQAQFTPLPTSTPTVGVTPTATPATPTISPTPGEERSGNGTNFTIPRCQATITVNGESDDWDAQTAIPTLRLDQNTYGEGEWQGTNDLSGEMRLCWIDSTLYLFVRATDDIHVQTQRGGDAWKGDEVELLFDADLRSDFFDEEWNADDTQLGLSPGDFGEIAPGAVQYHPSFKDNLELALSAHRPPEAGGNYVIEAGIPWGILRITPRAGTKYGFCLALSDNDHVGTAQQDSMVSHCTELRVPDPTTWVTITLGP